MYSAQLKNILHLRCSLSNNLLSMLVNDFSLFLCWREKRGLEEHQQQDIYIPIIGKDGVPLDTPEVQKAKERHIYALAKAKAREHNPHHQQEEDEEIAEYPPPDP